MKNLTIGGRFFYDKMQKDLKKGGQTEMDGLIFEMVRMGHRYGAPVGNYEKIAAKFGYC